MDPERERMRLAEQYARMNDQELEELAEDWDALTDAARIALKQEMNRRGIGCPGEETAAAEEHGDALADPVAVAEFPGAGEAFLAWGLLRSGGIQCRLSYANHELFDPGEYARYRPEQESVQGFSLLAGRITLSVSAADYDAAREVLNRPADEDPGDQD